MTGSTQLRELRRTLHGAVLATVLVGVTACDAVGSGGGEAEAKQLVAEFWEAENSNDGYGDCAKIEAITTEHFQDSLGCDWLTAVSTAEVVGDVTVERTDNDHLKVRQQIESWAYDGTMVFDVIRVDDEWLIDYVDAL